MNFQDGDKVAGIYGGNEWTRSNGLWYFTGPRNDNGTGTMAYSDSTMQSLIDMRVDVPDYVPPPNQKLSKSDPIKPPVYRYNYKYIPKEQA